MNLYEIKNVDTGQIIVPAILAREAAKLLDCSTNTIIGSYFGNYTLRKKYRVERVDTAISPKDPLWTEWEIRRNWLLKLCGRT